MTEDEKLLRQFLSDRGGYNSPNELQSTHDLFSDIEDKLEEYFPESVPTSIYLECKELIKKHIDAIAGHSDKNHVLLLEKFVRYAYLSAPNDLIRPNFKGA